MNTRTKVIFFLLGTVSGAILTFLFLFIYALHQKSYVPENDDNIVLFEKPAQTIPCDALKIFQVEQNGNALAKLEKEDSFDFVVVYLMADESYSFYDDQKILVPKNKCLKQIGTYRYETRNNTIKTVPIVNFYDI